MPEVWERWPDWLRYPLGGAVLIGGLVLLFPAGEWLDVQGDAKERAEVVGVDAHPGTDDCHSRGSDATRPNLAVTWRSLNPPEGMDETFVQIEGCSVPDVGEFHTVYRIGGEPGNVLVLVDPADSISDVLQMAGGGAGAGIVFGIIYFGIDRARDRFANWRAPHPNRW
ncbi:hypothetical protein ACFVDI_07425 [Nocardioides sp. NPDC057767]|uniref:hypothetical protein n=1 Tax=unclassified Nocardioides TaxID=2615069 RepID=UPI00366F36D8